MSPREFEEKLRRLNKDFRVRSGGEVDYTDPAFPKHVRRDEVWCKDGHGVSYLVRSYRDHRFTGQDVLWFEAGERIRKRNEQVEMVNRLERERKEQIASLEKKDHAERIEMAKDNFKAARDWCRDNGVRGENTTVLDPEHKIRVFSSGIPT